MLKVIIMLGLLFSITGCMKTKGLRMTVHPKLFVQEDGRHRIVDELKR